MTKLSKNMKECLLCVKHQIEISKKSATLAEYVSAHEKCIEELDADFLDIYKEGYEEGKQNIAEIINQANTVKALERRGIVEILKIRNAYGNSLVKVKLLVDIDNLNLN